ncbi:MAG: phosphoglycerate dehydrogenase [Streptosporangiales bacterium]|nr:phosphoglycerate dehydrogenase [Streptosporangiales bacterium]
MPEGRVDVAVVEDVWGPAFDALASDLVVTRTPDAWTRPDELPAVLTGTRALVVRNRTTVDRALLAGCPSLQVVARAGVGLDNIDIGAADDLGVVVTAPLGANAVSVAEHTLGLALAVARHTIPLDRSVRSGEWNRRPGRELAGGVWGIVGFGATGRAVARAARGLDMEVVAHDPYVDEATAGVPMAPLDDVVARADVISVHLPANPDTRGIVDAGLLARTKPGAILVNAGRGEVVDEAALAEALTSGHLFGAALDVRADEPPAPGPLDGLDNVVLTPHIAGITTQSQERIADILAGDIRAVLDGTPARSAVGIARPARGGDRP